AIGWHRPTGCSFLVRDNLQLDLHTTLGDEGRYPTLARAYGLAPDTLFAAKVPASETAPRGTFALRDDHYLDYRVIHFFKHYCTKLIDALELALLFERLNVNHDLLRATVAQSNSGRVWACVLCILKVWGLEPAFDPVSDSDRAFAQTPRVRKILDEIARLDGGRSPVRLAAMMLPPNLRLRFAWELIWPRREVMLRLASRDEATWGELAFIRMRRMAKTFGGVIFGK
ncbi:MAG: hypothetical protein L6Q71_12400, partial [Planctomycetes bacterium]|nr:hypothetical protein [Planctomycetota bacterium]